jgi:hypothetical protein
MVPGEIFIRSLKDFYQIKMIILLLCFSVSSESRLERAHRGSHITIKAFDFGSRLEIKEEEGVAAHGNRGLPNVSR